MTRHQENDQSRLTETIGSDRDDRSEGAPAGALKSRTDQFAHNAAASVLHQVVLIALSFITRTVFIAQFGVELLGINTLFSSIVALLAFADLGINGAVMHALYRPLKEGDRGNVSALVDFAGKLFRWVALFVAVVGVLLVPFIEEIAQTEADLPNLELYYLLFLANTVASYLMLNRMVLLDADQKIYITKNISIVFEIVKALFQVGVLLIFESYLLFLIIQLAATLGKNWTIYIRAGRLYPFIKQRSPKLDKSARISLHQSVRAMMVFRIAGLVMSYSPPLLISVFASTLALGYYSNYMMIVAAATGITQVIFQALTPSVGNLVTGSDRQASRQAFNELTMASVLLHGASSVLIFVFINDFITIWLGPDFLLSSEVVLAIVFNFYVAGSMMPLWSFRNATGMFRNTQWVIVTTAMLSIVLALILGNYFEMAGVIVAGAIARIVTGGWYEPWLLIRKYLGGKLWIYFALQVSAIALWGGVAFGVVLLAEAFQVDALFTLLIKIGLVSALLPVATWVFFGRTSAYRSLKARVAHLARKVRN